MENGEGWMVPCHGGGWMVAGHISFLFEKKSRANHSAEGRSSSSCNEGVRRR